MSRPSRPSAGRKRSMSREISEPQREWLVGELDAWRAQGVLTDVQVGAVLDLYATSLENRARRQSKGLLALMAMAVVLVGLGVLLLVGYNWEAMPASARWRCLRGGVRGARRRAPAPVSPRAAWCVGDRLLPRQRPVRGRDLAARAGLPPRCAPAGRVLVVGAGGPAVRLAARHAAHPHAVRRPDGDLGRVRGARLCQPRGLVLRPASLRPERGVQPAADGPPGAALGVPQGFAPGRRAVCTPDRVVGDPPALCLAVADQPGLLHRGGRGPPALAGRGPPRGEPRWRPLTGSSARV